MPSGPSPRSPDSPGIRARRRLPRPVRTGKPAPRTPSEARPKNRVHDAPLRGELAGSGVAGSSGVPDAPNPPLGAGSRAPCTSGAQLRRAPAVDFVMRRLSLAAVVLGLAALHAAPATASL